MRKPFAVTVEQMSSKAAVGLHMSSTLAHTVLHHCVLVRSVGRF